MNMSSYQVPGKPKPAPQGAKTPKQSVLKPASPKPQNKTVKNESD